MIDGGDWTLRDMALFHEAVSTFKENAGQSTSFRVLYKQLDEQGLLLGRQNMPTKAHNKLYYGCGNKPEGLVT